MSEANGYKEKFYERYVKRALDVAFSIFALIVLSPIFLLCVALIKADDIHGDVFFRQKRNGRNGKVFSIIKFRTMKQELCGVDVDPTDSTLTRVGKVIRKLSLDEIPQFFSILSGNMSLIGPRPLLLSYYEWFNEKERKRFNVRPGITGLSQINGRANLSWDERFEFDVHYVEKLSFLLDVKVFYKTFFVVFSHKGVITDSNNMLERFDDYRRAKLKQKEVYTLNTRTKKRAVSAKSNAANARG